MNETKITCDGCGKDLTYTSNSVDYRLALVCERLLPEYDSMGYAVVTDMMIYPPIEKNAHFCGLQCLAKWKGLERYLPDSPPPS